jgi:hypothetical protein
MKPPVAAAGGGQERFDKRTTFLAHRRLRHAACLIAIPKQLLKLVDDENDLRRIDFKRFQYFTRPNADARSLNRRASARRRSELADASERARCAIGADAGLVMISCQPLARRKGTTPARTSDDLPEPDGPTTAVKPAACTFAAKVDVSRPRPKYQSASAVWNGRRPTNGGTGEVDVELMA